MKTPLLKCRERAGLSQQNLAHKCNTSTATISRLERGMTKCVSGEVCLVITEFFSDYGLTLKHLIQPESFPDFLLSVNQEDKQ